MLWLSAQIERIDKAELVCDPATVAFINHARSVDDVGARTAMIAFRGDVNATNEVGETALVAAILANNVEVVNMLVVWDSVDVETPVRGQPPIVWAVIAPGDDDRVLKLLHQQRCVDVKLPSGASTQHRYYPKTDGFARLCSVPSTVAHCRV